MTPEEIVDGRRIVVCVGSGGVGKTTISASLALGGARRGRRVLVLTIDHGLDVFTVPGSGCDCLLWPTSRGGPLRMGQPSDHGL